MRRGTIKERILIKARKTIPKVRIPKLRKILRKIQRIIQIIIRKKNKRIFQKWKWFLHQIHILLLMWYGMLWMMIRKLL